MKTASSSNSFSEIPRILYIVLQLFTLGVFIFLFLITYLTFDPYNFAERILILKKWSLYLGSAGILAIFIYLLFIKEDAQLAGWDAHRKNSKYGFGTSGYLLFIFSLIFVAIGSIWEVELKYFYLITFLLALNSLFQLAKAYTFSSTRPAWIHPTTFGNIIHGASGFGLGVCLLIFQASDLQITLIWLLIIVLIMEGLIIWSRFSFLSRASVATRQTASMMLGSHLTLFGVRFIFGLIMPLVYLLWILFVHDLPIQPAALMVIVGELSEKILFFITSVPQTDSMTM